MLRAFLTPLRAASGSRTSLFVCVAVVLALISGWGLAPISSADTAGDKKKVDSDIAQLRIDLEDTSQELADAFVELQRTKALLPGAQQALTAAEAEQKRADLHNEAVATALAVAEANAAKIEASLAENARSIQEAQDQLGNMAREVYQEGGVSALSMVLEANSAEDFTNRMIMMDTVTRVRGASLRGLDTVRAEGRAVRAHLIAVRQQVAELKVQAEAALAKAAAAREAAAAAKAKIDALYSAQTNYAAAVAAKKATEQASLNKMQERSNALQRTLAARAKAAREAAARRSSQNAPNGNDGGGGGGGYLSRPVDAQPNSNYGWRLHPILGYARLHAGIDFPVGCGTPVRAAADGTVIMANPESSTGGYGNQLVIEHGMHRGIYLTTTYNHLSGFAVTGGNVSRGQIVGYVGTTGTSTGCHLHFETRQDGNPVNPATWL